MKRNSSNGIRDRALGSLTYLLPMSAVVILGVFLFRQFPILAIIFSPLIQIALIGSLRIVDFISVRFVVWAVLFFAVVRNRNIGHFIRFNAMQAVLLDVVVSLFKVLIQMILILFGKFDFAASMLEVLATTAFLAVISGSFYSLFFAVQGKYANIPMISDAADFNARY
ncbi:MAG: Tic20 family protein [Pseudanabaena sp. ELA607]